MVGQALCGLEYRAGGKGNEPLWSRTSMVDYAGGFLGALGVLAALYHRARTGQGVTLESALMSAGAFLVSELVQRPDGRWEGAEPMNAARTGYHPSEALYQTNDGWIAVVVRGRKAAAGLADALGLGATLDADPLRWNDSAEHAIGKAIGARSTEDAVAALEKNGVWVERCRRDTNTQILRDAELERAGVLQVSQHPQVGTLRELGAMMRFSRSSVGHKRYAPLPGEQTNEILHELGWAASDIDALRAKNVVG
jgi:crotonobetainyl-CoA:carnitine CoA-transferase CaiB-like acyl-CoA transferase